MKRWKNPGFPTGGMLQGDAAIATFMLNLEHTANSPEIGPVFRSKTHNVKILNQRMLQAQVVFNRFL